MKTRKLLAILLTLAMMMGLLCTGAAATNPTNLTPYGTQYVDSITVTGVDVTNVSRTETVFNQALGNTRVTYDITLNQNTDATQTFSLSVVGTGSPVVVSPIPPAGPYYQFGPMISNNATTNYSVTLSGGIGSKTVYVHKNLQGAYGKYDAYVFNFTVATGPTPFDVLTDTNNTELTMQFGDPEGTPSSPEQDMYFIDSGTTNKYNVIYTGSLSAYYPNLLAFYVTDNKEDITSMNGGSAVHFVEFDSVTGEVSYEGSTPNPNSSTALNAGFYALKIIAAGDLTIQANNETVTLHFSAPHEAVTPMAGALTKVNGYLPVGQFATGSGWGALYKNGTNSSGDPQNPSPMKFSSGVETTGVSLGMLGGYIQFDADPNNTGVRITDDPKNPYGIDFIVYGNAFVGNPEAASVMVSDDGLTWYNLAGSRYYQSGTNTSVNISYLKIENAPVTIGTKTFSDSGVYCSKNYVPTYTAQSDIDAAIAAATWNGVPKAGGGTLLPGTPVWPEYDSASENYGNVWNDGKVSASGATATGKVYWNQSGSAEVITYCGVVEVEDDMAVLPQASPGPTQAETTDVYLWGYGDVRPNGSYYGAATNPYATNPSAGAVNGVGGDGFDLAWAVTASGVPAGLTSIRYIRVYTSVLYHAGNVGETSTEICGVYASTANTGTVGATGAPSVTITYPGSTFPFEPNTYSPSMPTSSGNTVSCISNIFGAASYSISITADSGANVFVNGTKLNETGTGVFSGPLEILSATQKIQILVQSGSAAPYIAVLK